MLKLVITHGREADCEECAGHYSLFLTPALVEEFYYVSKTYNLGDVVPLPRFSLRRPTKHPFRIAGADGPDRPVLELRFRFPKIFSRMSNFGIEQKVELVH